MKVSIEKTADGSVTLFREDMDEHYHSMKGAEAESAHVYVDLGWRHVAAPGRTLRVFEVGFGTGLNAALTAIAARGMSVPTHYYSIELYPLPVETAHEFASCQPIGLCEEIDAAVAAEWNSPVALSEHFTLEKINADFLAVELPQDIDVVYFDAFAPEKQPEMWSESLFRKLYAAMAPGGVLTTYCAKGAIRRMLKEIGFVVERLAGPAHGKREVLRATKPADQSSRPS